MYRSDDCLPSLRALCPCLEYPTPPPLPSLIVRAFSRLGNRVGMCCVLSHSHYWTALQNQRTNYGIYLKLLRFLFRFKHKCLEYTSILMVWSLGVTIMSNDWRCLPITYRKRYRFWQKSNQISDESKTICHFFE